MQFADESGDLEHDMSAVCKDEIGKVIPSGRMGSSDT